MRGPLNSYRYNGRRYFRRDIVATASFEATAGVLIERAKALIASVSIELTQSVYAQIARSLVSSVSMQLSAVVELVKVRIVDNFLYMRREKQDRTMRKETPK